MPQFFSLLFLGGGVNFGEGANFVYFLVNFWVD